MQRVRETLQDYRERVEREKKTVVGDASTDKLCSPKVMEKRLFVPLVDRLLSIDFLDSFFFRIWRELYDRSPKTTLITSVVIYLTGQAYFVWIQFGLVYFILCAMFALCLSLGKKNDGEISAYSVFNPNCERLLGQMTAEHFERDVLRKGVH